MKKITTSCLLALITILSFFIASESYAQSCCPQFEFQMSKFRCEAPDCGQSSAGLPDASVTMCQFSTNKIQVLPGITPGFTYVWSVTGGTINGNVLTTLSTVLPYVDVTWGGGSLGIISVTIFNSDSSCFQRLVQTVCLTKSPRAVFVKNTGDTVCKNQPITFFNTSLGIYTNWTWNFGDGNTQNGGMSATHAYSGNGTYIVSLTVSNSKSQNECGCSNTFYDTITISNSTGLQILAPDCKKMLCAGDTVTYCSSITGCAYYNWSALGGTVIGSGSCVKVIWNNLTPSVSNPTVSLTVPPTCAGSCGNSTSLIEKILYNGMPILGNSPVCLNAATTFSLPVLPGVFYNWSISPGTGYTIFNGTDINTPNFRVAFNVAGNYTITCTYIDSLRNCSGVSQYPLTVSPPFSILGPNTSCATCTSSYTTTPTGSFNWSINTIPVSTGSGSSYNKTWTTTQTGNFVLTATQIGSSFCNSPQQMLVTVAPKPVLTIFKSQNFACPGTVVKFWVNSNVTNTNITWTYPPGTTVLNNSGPFMDTIYLSFSGTGTKTVTATQQCTYSCTSTSISTSVTNPPNPVLASPKTTVCIDEVVTYNLASPLPGIVYTWSITNPNLGTIQSGQGTPTVTILWHGNATNTGTLRVSHCSGFVNVPITVTLPPAVSISQSGNCFSDGIGYTLTANPSGQTYLWSNGATTQIINATSAGTYSVTVNPSSSGSCPVTRSITLNPDNYELVITPPCIVNNCNLFSFSIPLTQLKFSMPCSANFQWFFKPVGGSIFSPIIGATGINYNATQLGCYRCVATCANGCNVTSNTICIPDDIYFCCNSSACSNIAFGIDFNQTGCNPTAFSGFYTGTGSPTGGFPVYYCYGDGTSELLPTLNASHQYGQAGQYNVCISQKTTVTNSSSGLTDTCCITNCRTIDVPAVAFFTASYNCTTGLLSMTDGSSFYPNSSGVIYSWSITGGTYTGTLGAVPNPTVTPTSSGNFTIILSVTKGSCTSTYTRVVSVVIPSVSFTVSPNPTCSRDIAYFIAPSGFTSYFWQFGDASYSYSAPAASPQHQYTNITATPINFTAVLTVTTPGGCTATSTQIISVHPKPIVTVTPNRDTICVGGSVLLTANINPNGNGMCTSYNYQWRLDGLNITGATGSTYLATNYGQYSVFVSGATPSCNCTMLSDTAFVSLYPRPIAKITSSSNICFDTAFNNPSYFNLTASNYAGYTYSWSSNLPGMTFTPNNATNGFTTASATLVNNGNFVIYLQVTDSNGCTAIDSLCFFTHTGPSVSINGTGTFCANSVNTLSIISPVNTNFYSWSNGASGMSINVTQAGYYFVTATNLLTGCSSTSNGYAINESPSLQLFPIGCDTICSDQNITIPLAQLPNLSNYQVNWYSGIKPAGTLIHSGPGAITLPAGFLSLGLHNLWATVSLPNGCVDSSGVFSVFIKKCCQCAGSSWAFKEYSLDSGISWKPLICNQEEIVTGCYPIIVNAGYNCSPAGCSGYVTGQLLNNLGNVITNINTFPYTFTPTPGASGTVYIKLYGWCDGVKCDSCVKMIYYNCPPVQPACGCDTAFHFTGQPILVLPPVGDGFVAGGVQMPIACGTTYSKPLDCQTPYQFFINYQHPWPNGNCTTTVLGEVLFGGNVIYSQTMVTQATPLNYTFTSQGFYCIKFKLMVNGTVCDSCTICFNVNCGAPCECKQEFTFSGNPVIVANFISPTDNTEKTITLPAPIICNTSLAKPLKCSTNYKFYINYTNPYTFPCVAKDSAVIIQQGNPTPLIINANTTSSNPINYSFTSSGTYCVKHYLKVNGRVCDSCIVCFSVECPNICNCDLYDFLSDPTITFIKGTVGTTSVSTAYQSPCQTSLAAQLQCGRKYRFFISSGPLSAQLPANCVSTVTATLTRNNLTIATFNNVSPANPFVYSFTKEGVYCIKYDLYVNGVLCKSCIQCFSVKCCLINYVLPALKGTFVGCAIGGTTRVFNDSIGGTFSSTDTTVARVDDNGIVTAVGYGTAIIVYRVFKDPCDYYAVAEYRVPAPVPLPAILGNGAICRLGDSTRFTNTVPLGTWSSSNPAVANVSTGATRINATQVRGISPGIANISYTVIQSGCPITTSRNVVVNNVVMNPITGPDNVCRGRTIQLENSSLIPAGFSTQWASTTTRASVNSSGLVTGVLAGITGIRYQLNYSNSAFGACSASVTRNVTVNALPSAPTLSFRTRPLYAAGTTNVCLKSSFVLSASILGGTWTSSGSVTVTNTGVVTAVATGTGRVTYTVFNSFGCSSSATLTFTVVACSNFSKALLPVTTANGQTMKDHSGNIILFPNPATDKVYFNIDVNTGDGVVVLTDLQGKQLCQKLFVPGLNSIPTSGYAAGMYMVTFKTKKGQQVQKLLLQ